MKLKRLGLAALLIYFILSSVSVTEASVLLNEIFADPPAGLAGDANGDGIRSGSDDEFIELLNFSDGDTDISGWYLTDSVSTRHIFAPGSVLGPYEFLAVFGGGSPGLPEIHWQTASSGTLSLNNSGDTISLFNTDAQMVSQAVYGSSAGQDQSITLFPDGETGEYFQHAAIEAAQGALFSPGRSVEGRLALAFHEEDQVPDNPVVPELPTFIYFLSGWMPVLLKRFQIS